MHFYDIIITMHNVFLTGGAYFVIIKKGENVEKLYFDDTQYDTLSYLI